MLDVIKTASQKALSRPCYFTGRACITPVLQKVSSKPLVSTPRK